MAALSDRPGNPSLMADCIGGLPFFMKKVFDPWKHLLHLMPYTMEAPKNGDSIF